MKSLSNIIKRHLVMTEEPKILESFILDEIESPSVIAVSAVQTEKAELEILKQESRHILAETENMVLELLEKARSDAKTIISDAQEEAAVIRAGVYEEAGHMRQQAQEEGYRAGLKKASEEIETDRMAALEQSQVIIEEARQTKLAMFNSMERDITQLVMAVSKKIIAGEIATNPRVVTNVVREAINLLDSPENVTVYVNPHDMENLLEEIQEHELLEPGAGEFPIEVHPSDRIQLGGCLVDSDIGRVDARLEVRTASMEKALLEVNDA
jgi:flagellar assembly protein FliH